MRLHVYYRHCTTFIRKCFTLDECFLLVDKQEKEVIKDLLFIFGKCLLKVTCLLFIFDLWFQYIALGGP
jgi:hypothetical protein